MITEKNNKSDDTKPEISRFAFAMFDVLGFSGWVQKVGLQKILDSYHSLIERAVTKPNEEGSLSAVQTPEGALFAVTGPPSYAYFSDTILLWCPLAPPLVGDFIERCSDLICEALAMGIPLRGAITLGDAVLDSEFNYFFGKPVIEAANLEKGQNWVGVTLGESALWPPFLTQLHGTAVIEYQPPMKEKYKGYASPIVLDWPRRWRDKNGECPSAELKRLNTEPAFSIYWENTIQFAELSLQKHDWHLRPEEIPDDAILRLVTRDEARF